ncbi:Laccase 11 [Hibiscus syriacus]|uniref:Laccase 11 n=1 Tax=Hibiscus syriacus TaxID=106335 RepID=A0A6A3BEK7_HIBSY|nr:Laccase 11 [Hibiscus syriacus]
MSFHLHKFPLLSRSGMLRKLIEECSTGDGASFSLRLDDLPGGAKAFELISKFCYGVKIELTAHNIVSVRCAAEYLEMTDDNGDENLVLQTESFLEEVLSWPLTVRESKQSPENNGLWNGISTGNWWFENVTFLSLPTYKRLILAIESRGMRPESIAASVAHYARTYLPLASAIATPDNIVEEEQLMNGSDSLGPLTMVARLIDGFLAEVAQDVNFKLPKFEALAASIPDYARPLDDGLYHAIDIYLKAHPWITDGEREQLCRLMNCQKISIEASTHAAQNERLPVRQNLMDAEHGVIDSEDDVSELEKDCSRSKSSDLRATPSSVNRQQNCENIEVVVPGALKVN